MKNRLSQALALFCLLGSVVTSFAQGLKINDLEYFEQTGFNVFVYNNNYAGIFCDEKKAGIEFIQRGVRITTGGGIRLTNTPEQWDIYPELVSRSVDKASQTITVELRYPQYDFTSRIAVTPKGKGFTMTVSLDKPVPDWLVGKAGFNLEFFPATYFGHSYMMDSRAEILPRHPANETVVKPTSERVPQFYGLSTFDDRGRGEFLENQSLDRGHKLVMAPESEDLRVAISSEQELQLFDGRALAQNGTFVVRTLLPAGKTGKVVEWYVEPAIDPSWRRAPNIGFSQIGYTPAQKKVAVLELDRADKVLASAQIIRVADDGSKSVALEPKVSQWGVFNHRYNYARIDFSEVTAPGVYYIKYGDSCTNIFPIGKDVYEGKWHTTMDVWLPVQMDHMQVNEGYRIWHGNSHRDDALQAPLNYEQFDGYKQGPQTNTKYKPLEHIPGLAVGAWYDAGDFDVQGGTVVGMTQDLSALWELFAPERDMTYIDQKTRYVDIHHPDGVPDLVQQILHGALNVNAQVENIGFVSHGIVQGNLHQYHHLGDGSTITDGYIYNPDLEPYVNDGHYSGTYDDRLVFTSNFSPAATMPTVAALAIASRALAEYYPEESQRCLKNALMLWNKYAKDATPREGDNGIGGNGGNRFRFDARVSAAIQLWLTTGDKKYKPYFEKEVFEPRLNLSYALAIYPKADKAFQQKVREAIPEYIKMTSERTKNNPYGIPLGAGGWGGNGSVISWAYNNYLIWKYFPDMMDPESVLAGLNYIYGTHPYSNVSFVNSIGVNTKKVAYGNNRADYTVIPGGIVPGLMGLNPDFLEHKDDYPFLWGENECCTGTVPSYVALSIACEEVARAINK